MKLYGVSISLFKPEDYYIMGVNLAWVKSGVLLHLMVISGST